jgi:hypothetical protein
MSRYFCVMIGLRGCYMPDSSFAIKVETRRELKQLLAEEAYPGDCQDGPSARTIASVAAACWRRRPTDRDSYLSTVLPTGPGYGIQINPITRNEYLDAQEAADAF